MRAFRQSLVFVLCALVLCAGLPQTAELRCMQGSSAAAGATPGKGCCAMDRCCCCSKPVALTDCDCRGPVREPTPTPPAPRQPLQRPEARPTPMPVTLPAAASCVRRPARARDAVPCALWPQRTRQEALSVWRL